MFVCVIVLVEVIYTRENLHVVLRSVHSEKEVFLLPTLRFPSQRQALLSGSVVFFWR